MEISVTESIWLAAESRRRWKRKGKELGRFRQNIDHFVNKNQQND